MDHRYVRFARVVAVTMLFVTATFHLWWGLPRSLVYARGLGALLARGVPPDPRPFLFVAFALVLLAGPYLVTRNVISARRAYQLGIVAMVLSFAAWVFWHETGHGAFLTGDPVPGAGGHSHGGTVLHTIVAHYAVEPIEGAIKSAELVAAAAFAFLLRFDPAADATD